MRPTDLDLNESLTRFIEREVAEGRFGSPGEVIEAALQLLEEREQRLRKLRSLMAEAERVKRS
jgi:antitoxin ParD1/3/4